MPDDPLAQFFEGESDPISKFFGAGAAPSVAPPPSLEELRAQRVRTASPRELARIHFGENVPLERQAAAVNPTLEAISGAAEQANELFTPPPGMWESAKSAIKAAPGVAYNAMFRPSALAPQIAPIPGQILGSMGKDIETMGSPTATPRDIGKAAVRFGATAYPVAKGVTGAVSGIRTLGAESRSATALTKANNRMMRAMDVSPKFSEARQVAAIDETTQTLKAMSPGPKAPFSDVESHAKFARKSADNYLKQYHGDPMANLGDVKVTVDGVEHSLSDLIAERSSLNKRTHAYQTAEKGAKGIMREINPRLDADVERLGKVRNAINTTGDQLAAQSQPQADIMRKYSHLQELADMAEANAHEWKTMKRLEAGGKDPKGTMLWNMMTKAGTLGMAGQSPQMMAKFSQALRNVWKAPKVDRDVLMARAAKHWKDITPAELPTPTPKSLPSITPASPTEIAPVPQPPPISGSSTGYPANTNPITGAIAGSTETPAQRAQSLFEAQTQIQTPPPITVPEAPTNKLSPLEERRTMNRIQSGYSGEERRAPEISAAEKERIANYRRQQKGTALYRKMSERRPGERGSISINPVPTPQKFVSIESLSNAQRSKLQELLNTKTNKELMDAGLQLRGSTRETTSRPSQFVRSQQGHTFSSVSFPPDFFDKFQ